MYSQTAADADDASSTLDVMFSELMPGRYNKKYQTPPASFFVFFSIYFFFFFFSFFADGTPRVYTAQCTFTDEFVTHEQNPRF